MNKINYEIFDNIELEAVRFLLNENTTLRRYYPLIPLVDSIIKQLSGCEIRDKYMFLEKITEGYESFSVECGISGEILVMFAAFLHLHDFKERRLNEINTVNKIFIEKLADLKIKNSGDYLKRCISDEDTDLDLIVCKYPDDAWKLFCLCDLMRLPGVREVRAELYYGCGLRVYNNFAGKDTCELQKMIAEYIEASACVRGVPLLKELSTQIAVANALPHIADFYQRTNKN